MRDQTIDLLRGFAILLVVMGHTILRSEFDENSNTLLFKIIWTLQMPLFFIISGYVTKYSKKGIKTLSDLRIFLWKKSKAYLMPLLIWAFAIKGLLIGYHEIFNFKSFATGVGGYWFFASLWTIVMIFSVCKYLSHKMVKDGGIKQSGVLLLLFVCFYVLLVVLALFVGMDKFALKYTLYYIPYFIGGYLMGQISNTRSLSISNITYLTIGILALVYFYLLINYNFWSAQDHLPIIILRYIASAAGCAVCAYLFAKWNNEGKYLLKTIQWFGLNSLEVYIIHFFFLGIIKYAEPYSILTLNGSALIILNFSLCILATYITILIIKNIPFLNKFLFYRF